jgi:hypothetical protein
MLRYAIIGFAAAALVSTTVIPDRALARGGGGGGGFHGGGFHGGDFHGGDFRHGGAFRGGALQGHPAQGRPIGTGAGRRVGAVGAAVGIPLRGVFAVRGASGAFAPRIVGRNYGSAYTGTAHAAQAARNVRAVGSIDRHAAASAATAAELAATRASSVGAAAGVPATGGYYGGSYDGYHNYNSCSRDSHGALVCPSQSSAVGHQGP